MTFPLPTIPAEPDATAPSVLISVLNWNSAAVTLNCIASVIALRCQPLRRVDILVIDNGSSHADFTVLSAGLDQGAVTLLRQDRNLGFAGGHNLAMQIAIDEGYDFIWLVNSDSLVEPDCLEQLLAIMAEDPVCGAVSPVIVAMDDCSVLDFCGAMHDWPRLESRRAGSIEEGQRWESEQPAAMWISGAVALFRVQALRQIGLLDAALFAYYEDNDIGARLSEAKWLSRVAFDARARHQRFASDIHHRPPYFFYLMARNGIRFWLKHAPAPYRRWIRARLVDRAMFEANILTSKSQLEKARACMLGIFDGLRGTGGPPVLDRKVPRHIRALRRMLLLQHAKHLASK